MNIKRISLVTLVTLTTLVITPAAVAKIYKCDGPDGPIYTDRECGPDAEDVELLESSGLSGVSEKDKSALAEKKLEREQAQSRNQRGTVVNNQYSTYTTESAGRSVRGRNRPVDRDKPITLPARPRPVTPRKKR
jgi:hypothetical protein